MRKVSVLQPVLVSNKQRAQENRKIFNKLKGLVINIIAAPGAGKTSLVMDIIQDLGKKYRILVIEGDIQGQLDSKRLAKLSTDVIQINTLTDCHLDAFMIAQVLPKIKRRYDLILVENVGNLVCPAEFDIGEDFKLAMLSTPEGDDKPLKYPLLFHLAKVVVINKIDLLPYVDFHIPAAKKAVKKRNPRAIVFEVSTKTVQGINKLVRFIETEISTKKRKLQNRTRL